VIAEGRIRTAAQARAAIAAGAFAAIIGTAITRPCEVAQYFAEAIEKEAARRSDSRYFLGIDLGGTNTKFGIVSAGGRLLFDSCLPTPAAEGRRGVLELLKRVVRIARESGAGLGLEIAAVGLATGGWVDARNGSIVYATDNLPGWTGTPVAEELAVASGLPVVVENDSNAAGVAEKAFGAGRGRSDFVCITLGTGVGGGCYSGGVLNRGAHFLANALGHMPLIPDGIPCNCGQRGCLEVYCNAAALQRYAGVAGASAADIVAAANAGDVGAAQAIRTLAGYLARGCAMLVEWMDPEAIILSGGLSMNNPILIETLRRELSLRVSVWERRRLMVLASELGYFGGVLGAAALARDAA
jgi:glucokinase